MATLARSRTTSIYASMFSWMRYTAPRTALVSTYRAAHSLASSSKAITQGNSEIRRPRKVKGREREEGTGQSLTESNQSTAKDAVSTSLKKRWKDRPRKSRKHEPDSTPEPPPAHEVHRSRMKELFPNGWNPPRKLSRDAMEGLRALNKLDPQNFTTPALAERFRISPEAVRRILRSKWEPTREERGKLIEREKTRRREAEERRKKRMDEERQLGETSWKRRKDRLSLR